MSLNARLEKVEEEEAEWRQLKKGMRQGHRQKDFVILDR